MDMHNSSPLILCEAINIRMFQILIGNFTFQSLVDFSQSSSCLHTVLLFGLQEDPTTLIQKRAKLDNSQSYDSQVNSMPALNTATPPST